MNRRNLPELLADLEDLRSRMRDAEVHSEVLAHISNAEIALRLLVMRTAPTDPPSRDSIPPLVEQNGPKRNEATKAFRNARKILEGVK